MYADYQKKVKQLISNTLTEMGCQPVIFAGSGISKRYFSAPNWIELLDIACKSNPLIDKDVLYYQQACSSLPEVAEAIMEKYHEWAWSGGRDQFPDEMFQSGVTRDRYLKYYLSKYIEKTQPETYDDLVGGENIKELTAFRNIRPNTLITTNYDQMLEVIFPDYTPIVGQTIIKTPSAMIGEVFKIHGCVTSIDEVVLTASDYKDWNNRKKYLSAKLLTYFLEHPVLILGYSAQDENVLSILRDIDEILSSDGEVVQNIYYVIYDPELNEEVSPPTEILLDLGGGSSMRVNAVYTRNYEWVYNAFSASEGLENVNPKILRALMSRTYDLVRHDIPKATIKVDYTTLEQVVKHDGELPKLLGITAVSDPEQFNAAYPYTLTAVGKKLGFSGWHKANRLLYLVCERTGEDIKQSDNQYHIAVKSGESGFVHKYSDATVELLQKVMNGENFDLSLTKK